MNFNLRLTWMNGKDWGVTTKVRRRSKEEMKNGIHSGMRNMCSCNRRSVSALIWEQISYLCQWHNALDVGIANVEVGNLFCLLQSRLCVSGVFHSPAQSLGWLQINHVVNLKVQLHYLIRVTVQSIKTERGYQLFDMFIEDS